MHVRGFICSLATAFFQVAITGWVCGRLTAQVDWTQHSPAVVPPARSGGALIYQTGVERNRFAVAVAC
jgi:hypothetical protein